MLAYHPNAPLFFLHSGQHTVVVTSEVTSNSRVVGPAPIAPVVFRGVGHTVEKENTLVLPVLSGASSSYSATLIKEIPASGSSLELAGKRMGLITAVQARNNARAVFSGSLDFFSDEFFAATLTATGKVRADSRGAGSGVEPAMACSITPWGLMCRTHTYMHYGRRRATCAWRWS